jgi:isopenicillin N synthase-like dioxygenase
MAATQEETPVLIAYSDLVAFANQDEASKDSLIEVIGLAYGADGLGLLAVTDVPNFCEKRERLLKLSLKLPYAKDLKDCELPDALYSTGWSHGKEQLAPGKPDWAKGSFYANPWLDSLVDYRSEKDGRTEHWQKQGKDFPEFYADNVWPQSLPDMRDAFMDLGQLMMQVGGLLAAVCDAYCAKHGVATNFHTTLTESRNSKGRLLHYFDMSHGNPVATATDEKKTSSSEEDMWCGWHNDHGSLTALAPGMFLDTEGNEVTNVKGAGLFVQARSGAVVRVRMPSTACGFQIGETSQIQSGGLLQATPHAVKSATLPGVTRQSFAIFLEPEFEAPLQIPANKTLEDCQASSVQLPPTVRPLRQRWEPGQTFGDFHSATVSAFAS